MGGSSRDQAQHPAKIPRTTQDHIPSFVWRLHPPSIHSPSTKPPNDYNSNVVPSENAFVHLRPKSVKELGIVGRVVDTAGPCTMVIEPTEPAEPRHDQVKPRTPNNHRVSIRQSNGIIKHNVRSSRLVPIYDRNTNRSKHITEGTVTVILTQDTTNYRQLAVSHLRSGDKVLEIGCSTGACTALLLRRLVLLCLDGSGELVAKNKCHDTDADPTQQFSLGEIVAFDTGLDMIQQTQQNLRLELEQLSAHTKRTPHELNEMYTHFISLHKMDALSDPKGASSLATINDEFPTMVLIDIGGNRELLGVTQMLRWVQVAFRQQPPRSIVVKSKALVEELLSMINTDANIAGAIRPTLSERGTVEHGQEWFLSMDTQHTAPHAIRTRPAYAHPMKAPLVFSPKDNTTPICRFHNYHIGGCKRYGDSGGEKLCPLDHEYCHWCRGKGHLARECSGL